MLVVLPFQVLCLVEPVQVVVVLQQAECRGLLHIGNGIGQEVVATFVVVRSEAFDVFLHHGMDALVAVDELSSVSNGDAAAFKGNIRCVCSITCRNDDIGLDNDIAAFFGHYADTPVAVIVPVAVENENGPAVRREIDGFAHFALSGEDFISVDIGDGIDTFFRPIAAHPLKTELTAVTHAEGVGVGSGSIGKVMVWCRHGSQQDVRCRIKNLDGIVVPTVAVAVGESESEFTLVFIRTKGRFEVEVIEVKIIRVVRIEFDGDIFGAFGE